MQLLYMHKKGSKRDVHKQLRISAYQYNICMQYVRCSRPSLRTIFYHLESKHLLSDHQNELQLLRIKDTQIIHIQLKRNLQACILYFDLQKSLNKVSHLQLIFKFNCIYGLASPLLDCIHNFLSNCKQQICVRGSFSIFSPVIIAKYHNVPQIVFWVLFFFYCSKFIMDAGLLMILKFTNLFHHEDQK